MMDLYSKDRHTCVYVCGGGGGGVKVTGVANKLVFTSDIIGSLQYLQYHYHIIHIIHFGGGGGGQVLAASSY